MVNRRKREEKEERVENFKYRKNTAKYKSYKSPSMKALPQIEKQTSFLGSFVINNYLNHKKIYFGTKDGEWYLTF